jgi:SH3 domain-containing YSC84-like protein 1
MKSTLCVVFSLLVCIFGLAASGAGQNSKEMKGAVERVDKSSAVMTEIMKIPDKSIPHDLLQKAKAIVVFPGSIKAGFIVGGQGGKGLAISRLGNGWSAPAFMNMGGGSVGLQIGGEKTDYVLLIMNDKGLRGILEDKFEVGGEGSVAAGPVGRTTAASTNASMDAEILTYSRSKGVFGGISLKGVVISQDKDMNTGVYNKQAKEILGVPGVAATAAPSALQKFPNTVATLAR